MLYGFLQDKNQLTVQPRQEGGQPWADAASARAPQPPLGQYEFTEPPSCEFMQPGTVSEMDNGFRRLSMNGIEGTQMTMEMGEDVNYVISRNNLSKRSV
jgi:hypothetical protein